MIYSLHMRPAARKACTQNSAIVKPPWGLTLYMHFKIIWGDRCKTASDLKINLQQEDDQNRSDKSLDIENIIQVNIQKTLWRHFFGSLGLCLL